MVPDFSSGSTTRNMAIPVATAPVDQPQVKIERSNQPCCISRGATHNPKNNVSPRPKINSMASSIPKDRKSTRLNSSHVSISYAVFCLKKKKTEYTDN